jgi:pimeloyl-ACP methyl ester carboxylesterase
MLARPSRDEPVEQFQRRMWITQVAPAFVEREPEKFDELMHQISSRVTPRVAMINQLRAIAGWHGSERLRGIHTPTTVVHGDLDPMVPVGNGIRLAKLIPETRYVELAGVGHLPALENPDALVHIVLEDS